MRKLASLLVLLGLALADDAPKERTFKDGKLVDPYWGLTYTAPGLEQGMFAATGPKVFEGRCAGGVEIEVVVQEADKEMSAADGMAMAKKQWAEKRKMQDVDEKDLTILTERASLAQAPPRLRSTRAAAGLHRPATVQRRATRRATRSRRRHGPHADPDAKPALIAISDLFAKQQAFSVDDPRVLFTAGQAYLSGNPQQRMPKNLVLAERLLERAIREAKPETFSPDQLWALHESMGIATLEARKLDVAIEWLTKSEQLAEKATEGAPGARNGQSSYNVACAYALSGKPDEAFAALDRCVAKGFLKVPDNVSREVDTDLDNLTRTRAGRGTSSRLPRPSSGRPPRPPVLRLHTRCAPTSRAGQSDPARREYASRRPPLPSSRALQRRGDHGRRPRRDREAGHGRRGHARHREGAVRAHARLRPLGRGRDAHRHDRRRRPVRVRGCARGRRRDRVHEGEGDVRGRSGRRSTRGEARARRLRQREAHRQGER
jgi:hypothetical protein